MFYGIGQQEFIFRDKALDPTFQDPCISRFCNLSFSKGSHSYHPHMDDGQPDPVANSGYGGFSRDRMRRSRLPYLTFSERTNWGSLSDFPLGNWNKIKADNLQKTDFPKRIATKRQPQTLLSTSTFTSGVFYSRNPDDGFQSASRGIERI
jgi:hypothetical protein